MAENKNNYQRFHSRLLAKPDDLIQQKMLNDKGEPVLSFLAEQFDKYLTKQHSAYSEIEWELEDSRSSFLRMKDFTKDERIFSSLFVNAIMSYGRVFVTADGRNGIKLEGSTHWVGSEKISVKRHNELMDFRNKLIAHAVHSPYRSCQTSIITNIVSKEQQPPIHANSIPRDISFGIGAFKFCISGFGSEDIDETAQFIDKIILKVQEKKKELETKLTQIVVDTLLVPEITKAKDQFEYK